jgi:transcriptional regulator with XRE-family HTH domain
MQIGVGKRLREWREARDLSQKEAAEGAGISQSEWQKLESGRSRNPSSNTLRHVESYTDGEFTVADLSPKTRLPKPFVGPLPKPFAKAS